MFLALLVFITGVISLNIPESCSGPGGMLSNATFCAVDSRFSCSNGTIVNTSRCPSGCLNGICRTAVCQYTTQIVPNRAGLCTVALSQRVDSIDNYNHDFDYDNATAVASAIFTYWVGDMNLSITCHTRAWALACNIAYPSCSVRNQCSQPYSEMITTCGEILPPGFNADLCSYIKLPPYTPDFAVIGISVSILVVVGGALLVAFIIHHKYERTSPFARFYNLAPKMDEESDPPTDE